MHVGKALDKLLKLLDSEPTNLDTFVKAVVLLHGLDKANSDFDIGERVNGIVREKIQDVRSWYEILCGLGEDLNLPKEDICGHIRNCLFTLKRQI